MKGFPEVTWRLCTQNLKASFFITFRQGLIAWLIEPIERYFSIFKPLMHNRNYSMPICLIATKYFQNPYLSNQLFDEPWKCSNWLFPLRIFNGICFNESWFLHIVVWSKPYKLDRFELSNDHLSLNEVYQRLMTRLINGSHESIYFREFSMRVLVRLVNWIPCPWNRKRGLESRPNDSTACFAFSLTSPTHAVSLLVDRIASKYQILMFWAGRFSSSA